MFLNSILIVRLFSFELYEFVIDSDMSDDNVFSIANLKDIRTMFF